MISSGVLGSKKGWRKLFFLYSFALLWIFLNQYPLLTCQYWSLQDSPLRLHRRENYNLKKIQSILQRPPSQLLASSSKLFDADTGNSNSTQMHLWNTQSILTYDTLLQTYHRSAFTWYLSISDFTAVSYVNNRKKQEMTFSGMCWDSGPIQASLSWTCLQDSLSLSFCYTGRLIMAPCHTQQKQELLRSRLRSSAQLRCEMWLQNKVLCFHKEPNYTSCSTIFWALVLPLRESHQNKPHQCNLGCAVGDCASWIWLCL